jgi:hypothetical protein
MLFSQDLHAGDELLDALVVGAHPSFSFFYMLAMSFSTRSSWAPTPAFLSSTCWR